MKRYGVIMAGGGGTRFWPLSRHKRPKQLLDLTGNGLMINETIERIHSEISYDNIFIVTNVDQSEAMYEAVSANIKKENILIEPLAKNTTACIGFAAEVIQKKYGEGIMCVFPADHYIKDEKEFQRVLGAGIKEVEEKEILLTIGIEASYPATGYGYIKYNKSETDFVRKVEKFVEKPDLKVAQQYIKDGNYVWNSGMFIWRVSTVLQEIERYLPKVYECLVKIERAVNSNEEKDVIDKIYSYIPEISIDYGVMEKSDKVYVVQGEFGWNDLGSWDMMGSLHEQDEQGNIIQGEVISIDTFDSIVYNTSKKTIATIGVENIVIVETEDALLVCNKEKTQDVKKAVEYLKAHDKIELL